MTDDKPLPTIMDIIQEAKNTFKPNPNPTRDFIIGALAFMVQ